MSKLNYFQFFTLHKNLNHCLLLSTTLSNVKVQLSSPRCSLGPPAVLPAGSRCVMYIMLDQDHTLPYCLRGRVLACFRRCRLPFMPSRHFSRRLPLNMMRLSATPSLLARIPPNTHSRNRPHTAGELTMCVQHAADPSLLRGEPQKACRWPLRNKQGCLCFTY